MKHTRTEEETHTHRDAEHVCMGTLNKKGFGSNSGAKDEVNLKEMACRTM